MIYTVTLNPSIDYVVQVNSLDLGAVNRADIYLTKEYNFHQFLP